MGSECHQLQLLHSRICRAALQAGCTYASLIGFSIAYAVVPANAHIHLQVSNVWMVCNSNSLAKLLAYSSIAIWVTVATPCMPCPQLCCHSSACAVGHGPNVVSTMLVLMSCRKCLVSSRQQEHSPSAVANMQKLSVKPQES